MSTLNATRVATRLDKEIWVGDPSYGTTLAAAVTAIATTACTLHLAAGTHTVSANLTIPANIALAPEKGATISHGAYTVTVNGPIFAGAYQIFSGAGTVTLAAVTPLQYGVWTGGTGITVPVATTFSGVATFSDTPIFSAGGTFNAFPTTPSSAPDADYEVANKKFVDDSVGAIPAPIGYALRGSAAGFNPSDGTTYYVGALASVTPYGTAGNNRVYIPKAGTITKAWIFMFNSATGTAETSTIYIRLNDTTDTTISDAVTNNSAQSVFSNTALSIAVVAGDYIEIKWITPTWVGNPTSVLIAWTLFIE